jgi:CheY-like chemotaxis protein
MHILLADDDESVLMVARLGLRRAGFDVTVVEDGTSALARARQTAFDAVILDWDMPGLDGPDVCRQLLVDPSWTQVPVLFLTAASHEGVEDEARAAGAIGVLRKPFDPMTLGEQVKQLLAI